MVVDTEWWNWLGNNFSLNCNTSLTTILGFMQDNSSRFTREDSSASDDGGDSQSQSTVFILGGDYQMPSTTAQFTSMTNVCTVSTVPISNTNNTVSSLTTSQSLNNTIVTAVAANTTNSFSNLTSAHSASAILIPQGPFERLVCPRFLTRLFLFCFSFVLEIATMLDYPCSHQYSNSSLSCVHDLSLLKFCVTFSSRLIWSLVFLFFFFFNFLFSSCFFWLWSLSRLLHFAKCGCQSLKSNTMASVKEETRQSTISLNQDNVAPLPRNKKTAYVGSNRATPMPPPRRATSQQRFVLLNVRMCVSDIPPVIVFLMLLVFRCTQNPFKLFCCQ